MRVDKVSIKNFRLLKDVSLSFEPDSTVIVGRNNCGKTSLTELFRRLLSDKSPTFLLEDFSLPAHENFWKSFLLSRGGAEDSKVREILPVIEITLTIHYDKDSTDLGALTEFIIDLNPDCTEALILLRYQLREGGIDSLFGGIALDARGPEDRQKRDFFRAIRERIPSLYQTYVLAVDPNDPSNTKPVEWTNIRRLIRGGFINAQRGLDDETLRHKNVLGNILETLFQTAASSLAKPQDQNLARSLEEAVRDLQGNLDDKFNKQLDNLFPAFSLFGYPGLNDPSLRTETTLDVKRLLTNHTKVHYAGINGVNLPETYNGLGTRNLILILLKLVEFFRSFTTEQTEPGIHLVFIEEPEVHLHPQMQEVFINKLCNTPEILAKIFPDTPKWPVQFIVTTHSSHIANQASFQSIRYFLCRAYESSPNLQVTAVKDLREGISTTPSKDLEFLHKYMTLTRCDLLFADKAILIEGTTERLLLPRMIEKFDRTTSPTRQLGSQYISIVEVGGAHAHIFFDLLNFLELPTLVITDLDPVNRKNGGKSCRTSEGSHTGNACIKAWYGDPDISIAALLLKQPTDRVVQQRYLAHQIPETEGAACGRSFEDAFILANPDLFPLQEKTNIERECKALFIAAERFKSKSDFALKYAIYDTEWRIPRYIAEGLNWLSNQGLSNKTNTIAVPREKLPKSFSIAPKFTTSKPTRVKRKQG